MKRKLIELGGEMRKKKDEAILEMKNKLQSVRREQSQLRDILKRKENKEVNENDIKK